MDVAIVLAVSCKPLVKSNISAGEHNSNGDDRDTHTASFAGPITEMQETRTLPDPKQTQSTNQQPRNAVPRRRLQHFVVKSTRTATSDPRGIIAQPLPEISQS